MNYCFVGTCTGKKCPYSELFWSVFSRIRSEYGEIRRTIFTQWFPSEYSVEVSPLNSNKHALIKTLLKSQTINLGLAWFPKIKFPMLLKWTSILRTNAAVCMDNIHSNTGRAGAFEIVCDVNTAWKLSKHGVFSGPFIPVFGLNTGKYGPDTFHAV